MTLNQSKYIMNKECSFILFCLIFVWVFSLAYAETYSVQGTISVSTTTVQNALITFVDPSDTTQKYSALTDNSGHFQMDIVATSIESEPGSLPAKYELDLIKKLSAIKDTG